MPDFRDEVPTTPYEPGDVALVRRGVGSAAQPAVVVLGSAAIRNTGIAAGSIPMLDETAKLPVEVLPDGIGGGGEAPAPAEIRDALQTLTGADRLAVSAVRDAVSGTGITAIVALTQAAYDALSPKVATTLYVITD
jgi:hypothetical protein